MTLNSRDIFFVGLQIILFLLYIIDWPELTSALEKDIVIILYPAIFLIMMGFGIILKALFDLNKNLSPFPTPKKNMKLITKGLYGYIRHPIYTGILVLLLGYGMYSGSMTRLILTLLLLVLFYFKAKYEEVKLEERFTSYGNYIGITGMFLPKLFQSKRRNK